MDLHGKVILITGAKGGLGTFVTNSFLESGARVFGVSRSIADSDFPHPNFSAVAAELSDGDRARASCRKRVGKAGRIDGLVHLVGAFAGGAPSLRRTTRRSTRCWISICDRFSHDPSHFADHARTRGGADCRHREQGRRGTGCTGRRLWSVESRFGLVNRTIARENADVHVSANVVLPGTMDTPANCAADPNADYSKWVHPCQVAKLLVHLVSDQASQISGAVIPIYGGEA